MKITKMIKSLLGKFLAILAVLLIAGPVYALTPATVTPSGQVVTVPQTALDQSPALEVLTIIHYKKGFGHKPQHNPGGGSGPTTNCFGFLSKGAKLTSTENLSVNSTNSGLAASQVLASITNSATQWDSNTAASLFGAVSEDLAANFDSGDSPDGVNELSFGNYPIAGVIAVARVWGVFAGPPQGRYIDQFDILFDTDFVWGDATLDPALMDLENIATHEIGHGVGLADVYELVCAEVTEYGYSDNGETKKRTLELPDITGLQTLYSG